MRSAKLDDGLVALSETGIDLFPLMLEVAESVHEASDRGRQAWRSEATQDGAKMTGDATRLRVAFGAIFRAILREMPGPCTMVAEQAH